MSELQTEEAGADLNQGTAEVDAGTVESGADLATAEQETKTDGIDQEAVNKAINKKHFQMKEAERNAEASEERANKLEARLQKLEQGDDPVIPPPVDPYADDYEEKTRERDDAITRKAQFDSQQKFAADQVTRTQEDKVQADQTRIDGLVTEYNGRAVKLGLDASEVERAGETVVQYGISQDLATFILGDEEGPLITKYLAANPLELDALSRMSPMQAAIRVNAEIRTKAASLKPQISQAPEPTEVLSGRGAPEGSDPWLSGGTYS
jgi:hypothetical protein